MNFRIDTIFLFSSILLFFHCITSCKVSKTIIKNKTTKLEGYFFVPKMDSITEWNTYFFSDTNTLNLNKILKYGIMRDCDALVKSIDSSMDFLKNNNEIYPIAYDQICKKTSCGHKKSVQSEELKVSFTPGDTSIFYMYKVRIIGTYLNCNQKFSSIFGHVVWGRNILKKLPNRYRNIMDICLYQPLYYQLMDNDNKNHDIFFKN